MKTSAANKTLVERQNTIIPLHAERLCQQTPSVLSLVTRASNLIPQYCAPHLTIGCSRLVTMPQRTYLLAYLLLSTLLCSHRSTPILESQTPFTIVLDAGHGGKDSGALGRYSYEKDIALNIALQLGRYLNAYLPNVRVLYTRQSDVFVPLHQRAQYANAQQADVFFSIHCNSLERPNNSIEGTETYVMGLHRAEENLQVAKRENSAILLEPHYNQHYAGYDPHSAEGHIMLSMYQNAYLDQSLELASQLEQQFAQTIKRRSRGVKQAGFLVLRATTMPAVLVEAGFLSNSMEEYYLSSARGQAHLAAAMYRALEAYYQHRQREQPQHMVAMPTRPLVPRYVAPSTQRAGARSTQGGGVVYKVQLAAAPRKPEPYAQPWASMANLEYYWTGKHYKFLVGGYTSFQTAVASQQAWRREGYVDAFVVALKGGRLIPLSEARS